MGAGRRPRALQDDRRRQDLEAGAEDLREHRRHRRRARSAQSRRRRRHVVPAPPAFLHADRRRARERDPPQHRWRQDVEEGERPACRTSSSAGSASPSRRSTPTSCTRTSRRRTARAASSARPTTASPGRSAPTTTPARCTTATSSPIPSNVDRVYIPDVIFQVSDDGGKTLHSLGQRYMHVDNHVIWIDPDEHESPAGRQRRRPLPLVRPRRDVDVLREPAARAVLRRRRRQRRAVLQRLRRPAGQQLARRAVAHAVGARHPEPGLVRHAGRRRLRLARRSRGSEHDLRRAAARRHRALRQAHRRARRHPAAGREGRRAARAGTGTRRSSSRRTRTRGSTSARRCSIAPTIAATRWKIVSPDLTRQIDRNTLPVMGKVWGPDAVAKNTSTALYGNISAIAESPKKEGLLYVGTDDGLVQVSEDGGAHWRQGRAPARRAGQRVRRAHPRVAARRRRRSTSSSRTTRTATSRRTC